MPASKYKTNKQYLNAEKNFERERVKRGKRSVVLRVAKSDVKVLQKYRDIARNKRNALYVQRYEERTGYRTRSYRIHHDTYTAIKKFKESRSLSSYDAAFKLLLSYVNEDRD